MHPILIPKRRSRAWSSSRGSSAPSTACRFGKGSVLVISSLELVADACDETRFDKKVSGGLYHLRDFVGDGLFTAYTDEPNWVKAHRILMPTFGPAAMRNYFRRHARHR